MFIEIYRNENLNPVGMILLLNLIYCDYMLLNSKVCFYKKRPGKKPGLVKMNRLY